MLKSGLIVGGVSFVLTIIGGLVSLLLCGPCIALLAGVSTGYLAGVFDKPPDVGGSAKRGAGAGAIGGGLALAGHVLGGLANAVILGPEGATDVWRQLGIDLGTADPTTFYATSAGVACCLGVFDVLLMAGVGALGGLLWYQIAGKNMAPPAATG